MLVGQRAWPCDAVAPDDPRYRIAMSEEIFYAYRVALNHMTTAEIKNKRPYDGEVIWYSDGTMSRPYDNQRRGRWRSTRERFNGGRCEYCWAEARREDPANISENYNKLINIRSCTPEMQASADLHAEICGQCNRRVIHNITGVCLVCPVYCYPSQTTTQPSDPRSIVGNFSK